MNCSLRFVCKPRNGKSRSVKWGKALENPQNTWSCPNKLRECCAFVWQHRGISFQIDFPQMRNRLFTDEDKPRGACLPNFQSFFDVGKCQLKFRFINRTKRCGRTISIYRRRASQNAWQILCSACCLASMRRKDSGSAKWLCGPPADPGEGPGPLPPRFFSNSYSFQTILRENPYLSKFWAQGPLWGQNSAGPPDQNPGSAACVSARTIYS